MLSLRMALPGMPMLAALSANHLAAILFPPALRRLYIARDRDPAGETATETLADRAHRAGIDAIALTPRFSDFNEDLCRLGIDGASHRVADHARPGGRRPLPALSTRPERNEASAAPKVGRRIGSPVTHPCRRGRARPSRGRSDGRRPGRQRRSFCFLPLPPPPRHASVAGTPDRRHSSRDKKAGPPSSAPLRPPSLRSAVPARPARRLVIASKAAMGAADPARDITMATDRDDLDLERSARLLSDRPRPRRTAALRLPPVRGRARPATAARSQGRRRRRRRHLRRPRRDTRRHPPRTRPRRPALVDGQPLPSRRRPHRARARRQRAGTAEAARRSRTAPKSARSSSSASPHKA